MAHRFAFTVRVELERSQGKFATRDEMADNLRDAIEGADPGGVYGIGDYGDSDYDVVSWEVEDDDSAETLKALRKRVKELETKLSKVSS